MASTIVKYGAKKMLKSKSGEGSSEKWKENDPYYYWEQKRDKYTGERLYDRKDRPIFVGKPLRKDKLYYMERCGMSENDANVLAKLKRRAQKWDGSPNAESLRQRYGWSVVIGAVPVVGDTADALIALSFVKSAGKLTGGPGAAVRTKMLFNIAIDFGIGLVPIIGDFADAEFRANTRNTVMLEKALIKRAKAELAKMEKHGVADHESYTDDESHDSPPLQPTGPTHDARDRSSPHGSARRQLMPEQSFHSKSGGWTKGRGQGSNQYRNVHDEYDTPPRPSRHETDGYNGGQGRRFVSARDL